MLKKYEELWPDKKPVTHQELIHWQVRSIHWGYYKFKPLADYRFNCFMGIAIAIVETHYNCQQIISNCKYREMAVLQGYELGGCNSH